MTGADLIVRERLRQKEVEGFSVEHDVQAYTSDELTRAAYCYMLAAVAPRYLAAGEHVEANPPDAWPWDPSWWKPNLADPARTGPWRTTARALCCSSAAAPTWRWRRLVAGC